MFARAALIALRYFVRYFVFFSVFCLLVVLGWLSVPVQLTDWKLPTQLMGTLNHTHSLH